MQLLHKHCPTFRRDFSICKFRYSWGPWKQPPYQRKTAGCTAEYQFITRILVHAYIIYRNEIKPDTVACTCNPSNRESEAGGSWVQSKPGLCSESTYEKTKEKLGLRRWLRALAVVAEGLGLVPSTHMEVHNHPRVTNVFWCPLLAPIELHTCGAHAFTHIK